MATAQQITENIDRITTRTDRVIMPGIKKLYTSHSPIAHVFLGDGSDPGEHGGSPLAGAGKRSQSGGHKVQIQVSVERNSTAGMLAGPWAKYDTTPQDLNRRAEVNWKHGAATRTLSLYDQLINQGDAAIVDALTDETTNAYASLVEVLAEGLAQGTTLGANYTTGLEEAAGANDTFQTLAGSSYSAWNSRGISARGTAAASVSFTGGVFSTVGIARMRTAWHNTTEGMVRPNVIFTTYDIAEDYESLIVPQERYTGGNASGDASTSSIAFKTAPILADPFVNSGSMIFWNTDKGYLKCLSGADLQFQPWKHATEQEAMTSELVFKGQLCVEDRRFVNKIVSFT